MELWVRSQDKRILQKVDNIFLDANYGNKRISTYDGNNTELGTYETKERALEVLGMIEDALIARRMIDIYGNNSALFKGISGDNIKKTFNITVVFEMPEK